MASFADPIKLVLSVPAEADSIELWSRDFRCIPHPPAKRDSADATPTVADWRPQRLASRRALLKEILSTRWPGSPDSKQCGVLADPSPTPRPAELEGRRQARRTQEGTTSGLAAIAARICAETVSLPMPSKPLPKPTKDGNVTVYEIEVTPEELDQPLEVPMTEENTRLVVRLARKRFVFSV